MATPMWLRATLRLRSVPFEELHHPAAYAALEVARSEHFSDDRMAKVVMVMADGRPVELILPASRYVNLVRVRGLLNARAVRLASEEEMEMYFTGCEVGAVPPLRHCADIPVLMDRSLLVEGPILFQAGTHEDAVRVDFNDWFEMVRPRVADFGIPAEPVSV
jgi:Ala-tRNA(Pro) deacylase